MSLNFKEYIFSLLCKKNLKWGEVKKKKLNKVELLKVQKGEWINFWKRFEQEEPSFNGKVIVDYGSGFGYDSLFMLESGASHVYCLEVTEDRLKSCSHMHLSHGYHNATYIDNNNVEKLKDKIGTNKIDIIVCRDVMEHVPVPKVVLKSMYDILKPGGIAYIGFSPLYKSPFGPHISSYCKMPYVHIIFSEKTIIKVLKKLYGLPPTVHGYLDIPGSGVNKLSYFEYIDYLNRFDWSIAKSLINSFQNRRLMKSVINLFVFLIPFKSVQELIIVNSYVKLVKRNI